MRTRTSVHPLQYPLAVCVRGGVANGWKTDERMRTRASVHPLQYPLATLYDISFAGDGYGLTLKLCHFDLAQPNALHALARQ
jgi:hypothetical protein